MNKILIVEDDAAIRKALTEKFKYEGFHVISAEDGEKGLATAKTEKPEVILLDLILPGKDGLGVLEDLRRDRETAFIPIIVLTNVSNENVEEAAKKLNVEYFLIKTDWKLEDIVEKVKLLLNKK